MQVQGVDYRFQEKMRGVVEYMQYREMPADIKRKVPTLQCNVTRAGARSLYCGAWQHRKIWSGQEYRGSAPLFYPRETGRTARGAPDITREALRLRRIAT